MDAEQRHPVKEIELRSVAALLRRQFRVMLISTAVVFGAAIAFLYFATPTYTATALILVDPEPQSILNSGTGYQSSAGRDNARVDSEVEILKSDAIAIAVIEHEQLVADREFGGQLSVSAKLARAVGIANAAQPNQKKVLSKTLLRFKKATAIRRKGLTYLITVSTASSSPAKAAILANRFSEIYITQQVQAKIDRSLTARDMLNKQIVAARVSLASYEKAFDQYLDQNIDSLKINSDSGSFADLRQELDRAEQNRRDQLLLQSTVDQMLKQSSWSKLAIALDDTQLSDLSKERLALLHRLDSGKMSDPSLDLRQAFARLDRQLENRSIARLQALSAEVQDIDQTIAGLRGQLRRSILAQDLSPGFLTDIYAIQQETSIARVQYDNLLSRMRDLDTQANIQIADSRIISPALEPVLATYPNGSLVLLIALAASMGLGVSLAFLKEYYIGGITSALQLADLLSTTSATSIPAGSTENSRMQSVADIVVDAPLSIYSESVRTLRATIDQSFRASRSVGNNPQLAGGKAILLTSARSDEGKSTMALSLARSYAEAGRKTLLIDADLRKPSIHRLLGFDPQVGFLDYLRNSAGTALTGSFYARDPSSSLSLILGAAPSEYPTDQLLCSPTFQALLTQAKEVYEFVIIDSPPLLPVVDARYIAHYADAIVLVVKWASTSQNDLKLAIQPLRDAKKPNAAILPVLTQIKDPGRQSVYGYSSNSYSAAI